MSDPILSKYAGYPGFPFDDWVDEITSFHALVSFWSEVFKVDVADAELKFVPMLELKQQPEGPVFAVTSRDSRRGFRVTHVSQANAETHSGFFVTGRMDTNFEPLPDSFTLDVGTDLSEPRIGVIRALLRQQFGGAPRSLAVRNSELDAMITQYPDLFPAMVKTTQAFLEARREKDEDW